MPRAFGPFELRELVARSDRTMLWAARDSRLAVDMWVTMPRAAPASLALGQRWLEQARRIARLSHPRLVPVAECGIVDGWPFVAVERRHGVLLEQHLAGREAPAHEAVATWLSEALEGLAYAHEAGVSHGDLQRWSLVVDDRGQSRLMSIGVCLDVADAETDAAGVASRSMPVDPAALRSRRLAAERDVLSLGIVGLGLLAGEPALGEPDVGRVIERMPPIGRDGVRLPWTTPYPISEGLRTIINRATHSQHRQRYLAARSFLRAIDGWRAAESQDNGGPVAILLDRLRTVGHLPAMPAVAMMVRRLSRMERQRIGEIAEVVLMDLALSFELLRQVNSAQVRGSQISGNGPVLTVRRAIAMVGLNGTRRAADGLRAWPGPLDESAASRLQALIQRVRLAGHLAQQLRPTGYDAEVVFLLATLQNLGRLLLAYHFPDDAEQIAQLMSSQAGGGEDASLQPGMSERDAAYAVLGCDAELLANAAARHWGLTDEVLHMVRRLPLERPVRPSEADADVLRATASAANELVDAVHQLLPNARLEIALDPVTRRYGRQLGLQMRDFAEALRLARIAQRDGMLDTDDASETLAASVGDRAGAAVAVDPGPDAAAAVRTPGTPG